MVPVISQAHSPYSCSNESVTLASHSCCSQYLVTITSIQSTSTCSSPHTSEARRPLTLCLLYANTCHADPPGIDTPPRPLYIVDTFAPVTRSATSRTSDHHSRQRLMRPIATSTEVGLRPADRKSRSKNGTPAALCKPTATTMPL